MKHFILFLLLTLILVACSTTPGTLKSPSCDDGYVNNPPPEGIITLVVPTYLDVNFEPRQRAKIHQAIAEWNKTLNGYQVYTIVSDTFDMQPEVLIKINASREGLVILARTTEDEFVKEELPPGTLAWVPALGAPIVNIITDRIGSRDLKAITMHEIGHTLGIPHILVKYSLLYPAYPFGTNCIDELTVRSLSSVQSRFDMKHLQYCRRSGPN